MKPFTIIRGALLLAAPMLLDAPAALAQGGESTRLHLGSALTATHSSSSTGSSLVRTIVGLFVVIAVIYGVSWVLRQVKGGRTRASGNALSSVASLPLGSNRSLALVRVGRELVLLGVAEGGVTPIRTYTDEEALADLDLAEDDLDPEGSDSPASKLISTLRRLTVRA